MKKTILLALVVLSVSVTGQAALIELIPSNPIVGESEIVALELRISGLGDGAAPSVGVFDIDVDYDSSILAPVSAVIGDPVLGDQLALFFPSLSIVTPNPASFNLFELSLDDVVTLDLLQAPAFTMATLTFNTTATGTAAVTANVISLGDSLGGPIDFQTAGASVTVLRDGVQIPEPSARSLVILGALGLLFRARCRHS